MRADYRDRSTPTGLHKGHMGLDIALRAPSYHLKSTTILPTPDLSAMASYVPATSFYPFPWRAPDILKPQPAPPLTSFPEDHMRIVYNDGDWPPMPEDAGISKEQDKLTCKSTLSAVNACTKPAMVSAQPLSLLPAKMGGYSWKGEPGHSGSDREYIVKEDQVVYPGGCSVLFFLFLNFIHSLSRATNVRREGGYSASRSAHIGVT